MSGKRTDDEAYIEWADFRMQTPSKELQACMMDLHWFVNNGNWKHGARDLARFAFYALRTLVSPRLRGDSLSTGTHLFVIDTPGVGGIQTLVPVLQRKPPTEQVTIALTDFIFRDQATRSTLAQIPGVRLLNIDRVRGRLQPDTGLLGDLFRLVCRFPRLWATAPLFAWRHHAYSAVARDCVKAGTCGVVVFNERMLPSACFSAAARKLGVAVAAVQHGNLVPNYLPIMVDRYLTWGRFHSDWIRERSDCQVEEIGSPRTDKLVTARPDTEPADATQEPFTFVFFSQVGSASVSPEMIGHTRRQILSLAADTTLRVVVRLHPLDSRENWWAEGPDAKMVEYVDGAVDLAQVLDTAHMVCSFYSTVLVEALLWEMPVVQLNPFPDKVAFFPDRDGIPWVSDESELRRAVARWRQGTAQDREPVLARQQALREGYFAHFGHASETFWRVLGTPRDPELQSTSP